MKAADEKSTANGEQRLADKRRRGNKRSSVKLRTASKLRETG
jgi:hypothetical protein